MQLINMHTLQRTIFVPELFKITYFIYDCFLKDFLRLNFHLSIYIFLQTSSAEDTMSAIYEIL